MTHADAAKMLGLHFVSVHRLRRQGKLLPAPDGVDNASVVAYLRQMSPPPGYIEGAAAAEILKIPKREMSGVARANLVRSVPRPGGGWWVHEEDVAQLQTRPAALAVLGMKIEPPPGWIDAGTACKRLDCSRSWLSRLARRGLIRRRMYGKLNAWYLEDDIAAYLAA